MSLSNMFRFATIANLKMLSNKLPCLMISRNLNTCFPNLTQRVSLLLMSKCTSTYCSLEGILPGKKNLCRNVSGTPPVQKSFNISSNDDFMDKVMNSNVPVIVNFHAEWCDPCHILTPQLKELVDNSESINLAIVDVEANPDLVHTFEVKAVPAVLAIRNGLVIDKFIGLVDADMIKNLVSKLTVK